LIRYSAGRQSASEQHDTVVPGCSRLRNHGARVGSALCGGAAAAEAAKSSISARAEPLIDRTPARAIERKTLASNGFEPDIRSAYRTPTAVQKRVLSTRFKYVKTNVSHIVYAFLMDISFTMM
jgi:hypothetical protein